MKTKASMVSRLEGMPGRVQIGSNHPVNGALVKIVTNRFGGLLVEVIERHKDYHKGEQVVIAPIDFVRLK